MTSHSVAQLLATLGVTKSHSRPHVSNDNPFSESQFKTLKYRPEFPDRFASIEHGLEFCGRFFHWQNHEHHHWGLGLLTPLLMAVHMTQLEDGEIEAAAATGLSVVHCPESNLKLASGGCRTADLVAAGVNVALGTDGAASNNDLDMLGEMRSAALQAKGVNADACALPADQALRMASLNGARALGIDHETGSLQVGKSADIVAVDLAQPETQPVFNPVSQIVYAAGREQVRHVWISGRQLLKDRALTTIDLGETLQRTATWRERIAGRST